MKKHIFLLIALFSFINISSLFAYENDFFKVKDNGWNRKDLPNGNYHFVLKDYKPEDKTIKSFTPNIVVSVKNHDHDEYKYIDDEKKYLKEIDDAIKKSCKLQAKEFKEAMIKDALKAFPNMPKSKIEKQLEKELEQYSCEASDSHYKFINKHRGVESEYNIYIVKVRTLTILTMKRLYFLEIKYPEFVDIDSLDAYKEFISSFQIKDKEATFFNALLYSKVIPTGLYMLGFGLLAALGVIIRKNVG